MFSVAEQLLQAPLEGIHNTVILGALNGTTELGRTLAEGAGDHSSDLAEAAHNNINTKTHTIDYKLKLLPKTITDDTNITLTIGEDVYPMDRNGDFFEVIIPFSLFSNDKEENALIQVETNGEKKSQKVEKFRKR